MSEAPSANTSVTTPAVMMAPGAPTSVLPGTCPNSPSAPAMLAVTLASINPVASFHCRPGMVRTIRAVVRPVVHRS